MGVNVTRVVVYSRVSTEEQITASQLVEVERYCRERGYTIARVFEEDISGAVDPLDRPVFREMLDFVRRNGITTIVMYDMTRFYRPSSPLQAMVRLREIMEEYGVVIEFVAEPQIEDPMLNELWRFIKAFISGYERRMISMRTKYGLARLKREGRLYHRPSLLHYYAYTYSGREKPPDDPREREGIFKELTLDEIRIAARSFKALVDRILRRHPWEAVPVIAAQDPIIQTMYEYFPNAPRSVSSFKRAYRLASAILGTPQPSRAY